MLSRQTATAGAMPTPSLFDIPACRRRARSASAAWASAVPWRSPRSVQMASARRSVRPVSSSPSTGGASLAVAAVAAASVVKAEAELDGRSRGGGPGRSTGRLSGAGAGGVAEALGEKAEREGGERVCE